MGAGKKQRKKLGVAEAVFHGGVKLAKNLIPDDDEDIFIFEDLRI